MNLTQIILITFAVFMIIQTLIQLRREKLTLSQSILWGIVWIAVISGVLIQNHIIEIGRSIGVDVINLVVFVSIAIIFIVLYRQQIKQELLNRQITQLVRERSIDNVKSQKKS